jgi:hypothetical protein
VTAIEPFQAFGRLPPDQISTFIGVKPGDHLRLDGSAFTTISVQFPGPRSSNPAASTYTVYSPCLDEGYTSGYNFGTVPSGGLTLSHCGATTDFVEVAYDQAGNALEYYRVADVAVADLGTVDLSMQTYAATSTKTLTYTDLPAGYGSVQVTDSLATPAGREFDIQTTALAGTAAPLAIPAFTGATEIVESSAYNGHAGQQTIIEWGPFAATYTLDVGTHVLPDLLNAPSYDAPTHTISWSEGSGGVAPDFARLTVDASRLSDGKYWTWTVVAPHATSITLPTLPTTLYDYNIAAADFGGATIAIGKVPGGYDAVRPYLASFGSYRDFIQGASGSLAYETLVLAFRSTMTPHAPSLHPRVLSHRLR